jgi:NAD+ synthase (glutamine-hydrolysing)
VVRQNETSEGAAVETLANPTSVYDVTFDNVQAGLRTDYLFRLASPHSGFVVGTGD